MSALIIGVDPAERCGALVVVNAADGVAVAATSYSRCIRRGQHAWLVDEVVVGRRGRAIEHGHRVCRSIHEIGATVHALVGGAAGAVPYRLLVEGLFGRGPTLATLAYAAGCLAGPFEAGADGPPLRPMASTWRSALLGATDSATAVPLALAWAARHRPQLGALVDVEHVAEALCMTEWARRFA